MLLAFLFSFSAVASADTFQCHMGSSVMESPLVEGQSQLTAPGLDASLGATSYFIAYENGGNRVSFSASEQSVNDEAELANGSSSVRCRRQVANPPLPPPLPEEKDFLLCMLDEARFENGTVVDSKRKLTKVFSPLRLSMPITLRMEDQDAAFEVKLVTFDSRKGLQAKIYDKVTGDTARFAGPARALRSSFLLGLNEGKREVAAKFLRLACIWTNDPKAF